MSEPRSFAASLVSVLSFLACGCGDPVLSRSDVEQQVMQNLSASVGKPSPPITCPGDMKAKVGEAMTCSMAIDGKVHDVSVVVTAVDGNKAKFSAEVAVKPRA